MAAVAQAKIAATEERLATLALPQSGVWLRRAREAARQRLSEMGLPSRRDEYWRYTDPMSLNAPEAPCAAVFDAADEAPTFDAIDRLKVVFVDGVFSPELSDDLSLAGVEIARLADAGSHDLHWARDLYGVLEARGQVPVQRPLAALATAYATDGLLIRATGKAAKALNLVYHHSSDGSDAILQHCIKVETGAEVTILENGAAAARFTIGMEVDVADGGRFHHVRVQGRAHQRRAATHLFARLGAESVFKSFTLTANGVLTRNEAVIEMNGDEGVAHVAGAAVGDGKFHHDDTVFVTHAGERCESRQVFKKVLKNGAVGVFQGKILVKPGAQQTDGYQISQSLLLDDDSQFLAKPELEIYADDVKCSHGSTSGAIDETAMFYLRSRGVPVPEARVLLVLAFLAEALDEVEDAEIAEDVRSRLEGWLLRHRG